MVLFFLNLRIPKACHRHQDYMSWGCTLKSLYSSGQNKEGRRVLQGNFKTVGLDVILRYIYAAQINNEIFNVPYLSLEQVCV
jgi:hypothetical protein